MGNMAYCRFENTADDLQDCAGHLADGGLSAAETSARKRFVRLCRDIVFDWDNHVKNDVEDNED